MNKWFRSKQSHREDELNPKEWTSDSDLNNLMVREDEKKLKEWTSGSDLNNLIERGWIESKKMTKRYGSKKSHRERERLNRMQKNEQVIQI
jgi:hypothetical protein